MLTTEFVSLPLYTCIFSATSLWIDGLCLTLRKNITSKVEIFTGLMFKIKSELWIFKGATVIMTQYVIIIFALPTMIFRAEISHLFLKFVSKPFNKWLKKFFLVLRVGAKICVESMQISCELKGKWGIELQWSCNKLCEIVQKWFHWYKRQLLIYIITKSFFNRGFEEVQKGNP